MPTVTPGVFIQVRTPVCHASGSHIPQLSPARGKQAHQSCRPAWHSRSPSPQAAELRKGWALWGAVFRKTEFGRGHSWNVGFNRPGGERKAWRWGAGGDDRHPGSSGLPSKKSVGFPGGSDSKVSACNAGGQEFSSLYFPSFKEKQHLSEGRICSEPQKQT